MGFPFGGERGFPHPPSAWTPSLQAPNDFMEKKELAVKEQALPAQEAPRADMVSEVEKTVNFSLIDYPVYQYETGSTMFLSKRQRIVVDAYLKTGNEAEAARVLNEIGSRHGHFHKYSTKAISAWLRKPHVALYVAQKWVDQGKENWMDKPKWKAWGVDVLEGKKKATMAMVAIWKEFGKSQGWYEEKNPASVYNTQYNFLQANGKA